MLPYDADEPYPPEVEEVMARFGVWPFGAAVLLDLRDDYAVGKIRAGEPERVPPPPEVRALFKRIDDYLEWVRRLQA